MFAERYTSDAKNDIKFIYHSMGHFLLSFGQANEILMEALL